MTQCPIEVAKDFPRNGPSGTYSQAWMSRADQSFTSTAPNTCSVKSSGLTGCAQLGADADHEADLGLDVEARARAELDGSSFDLRWPRGRTIGVPEGTTVPARPW